MGICVQLLSAPCEPWRPWRKGRTEVCSELRGQMAACGRGGLRSQRGHRGLQELSSLAETGRTLLGPAKASKFIVGEGGRETELVRSARRLLGTLDLSSAAGQLLWEATEAQHSAHHTGTGTLLFLVGAWSRAAQECLQLGVPSPVLAAAMSEGLSACLGEVRALLVPLRGVPATSPLTLSSPRAAPEDGRCGPGAGLLTQGPAHRSSGPHPAVRAQVVAGGRALSSRMSALTHSRHFAGTRGLQGARGAAAQTLTSVDLRDGPLAPGASPLAPCCEGPVGLAELEAGLSHGDSGSMGLVGAVARWQWCSASSLDLSRVFTCCLPGFPESSRAFPGIVVAVPSSLGPLVAALQAKAIRVLLLEGDLTEGYRHPGFHGPERASTVLASVDGPQASAEEQWMDRVLQVLATFSVNLVLAQGRVAEGLLEHCVQSGCLALGSISGRTMRALAEASGAVPLDYITQAEEHCVGTGLRVAFGESTSWEAVEQTGRVTITLQAEGSPLVTAVLASPVVAQLPAREDGFWACAHRLSQALQDGQVFLGGGAMELLCLCHLHELARTPPMEEDQACPPRLPTAGSWLDSALALYRPTVLQGLARGWHQYLCALAVNSAAHPTELDASTCIRQRVQQAVGSGSPAAYISRLYEQLGCGALHGGPEERPGQAPKVYDVAAKVEAWRRALDLVLLVLQTDCEVITGLGPTHISSQGHEDLLHL